MIKNRIVSLFAAVLILFSVAAALPGRAVGVSGADIVAYARQFIGYKYVRNTHGPTTFDCSGFAHFVFAHFGIELPYSSADYWKNPSAYGEVIAYGSAADGQPGDIISWNGHVAIYTENGWCIEALNSRYGVVERFKVDTHPSGKNFRLIRIKGVEKAEPTTTTTNLVYLTTAPQGVTYEPDTDDFNELRDDGLPGDVNGDSRVNTSDARLVLRAAAGLEKLTDAQRIFADVNGDGRVNSKDARTILRVASRLETL